MKLFQQVTKCANCAHSKLKVDDQRLHSLECSQGFDPKEERLDSKDEVPSCWKHQASK